MEKRWMVKKEAEFNKKLNELTKSNTEMKSLEEHLLKENELIKNDRSFKELELEKLSQFWTITREQLEDQKHQSIEVEARLQRVKSAHIEQISLLHKRISMLQLSTKLEQTASTQTDPFGVDSDCTGYSSVIIQTESDYDRQKVNEVLKQHDEELETFIAEIENAKIQAQSDYKFAVVQMEQGLREEHEEELREIKEEKDRQLEEMVRIQSEQLQLIENDKMHMKAELSGEITNQKVELQQYMHNLEQKDSECNDLFDRLQASEKQNEGLTDKYRALNNKFEKNEIRGQILKKDARTIGDLRNRLEKIEEINEILLGEYKKLEHERNMFAEQVSYILKTGLGSSRSQQGSVRDVSVQNKAYEIGEQLDEIRRKYRAI
ncbi:hypothetical protein M3Y97_00024800 [Aphelenchoides bicaudatus]|nr:hypothetical protein M3Y97_00024800 [Aphelenchoides bicaudatus]